MLRREFGIHPSCTAKYIFSIYLAGHEEEGLVKKITLHFFSFSTLYFCAWKNLNSIGIRLKMKIGLFSNWFFAIYDFWHIPCECKMHFLTYDHLLVAFYILPQQPSLLTDTDVEYSTYCPCGRWGRCGSLLEFLDRHLAISVDSEQALANHIFSSLPQS